MREEIEKLKQRINELEDALAFYADPSTYFAIGFFPDPPCGDFMDDFEDCSRLDPNLGKEPGRKAREALNFWEELKKALTEYRDELKEEEEAMEKKKTAKLEEDPEELSKYRSDSDRRVRINVYRVHWENATGKKLTSTELEVADHGDVILDHINVLSQFHSIFKAPPDCVRSILQVEFVRQEPGTRFPPWARDKVEITPEEMKRCAEEGIEFAKEIERRIRMMVPKGVIR